VFVAVHAVEVLHAAPPVSSVAECHGTAVLPVFCHWMHWYSHGTPGVADSPSMRRLEGMNLSVVLSMFTFTIRGEAMFWHSAGRIAFPPASLPTAQFPVLHVVTWAPAVVAAKSTTSVAKTLSLASARRYYDAGK